MIAGMLRLVALLIGTVAALTACGAAVEYQNVLNPQLGPRDLERDTHVCEGRQQTETRASVSVTGLSFMSEPSVNAAAVQRCLSARGWRQVDH